MTPDTILTFFRMDFSKIPVLKERSHLVQFLRSAHDTARQNPFQVPWTDEMYGVVLDKLFELHKAEFTTLVQDFGKENVRVLETWYSSQSKRRMWTDLLVSNAVHEGGLDGIEFHTLFLHIRELESPEMVTDIIQKVLSSKKISGRVTQSVES